MAAIAPDPAVLGLLLAPALGALLTSIFLKDLIYAVIGFALGSALLAGVFALLGATFAALLELTVGAGLTAVLFLVAITLTRGKEGPDDE